MTTKRADFYREVTPSDDLSSFSNGTPISNGHGSRERPHSALPNGDVARDIGEPSPVSPSLKYRDVDRWESYGRTPANKQDLGYVSDSGSGSARVIPYNSGLLNNGSSLRKAGLIRPPRHLIDKVSRIVKGAYIRLFMRSDFRAEIQAFLDASQEVDEGNVFPYYTSLIQHFENHTLENGREFANILRENMPIPLREVVVFLEALMRDARSEINLALHPSLVPKYLPYLEGLKHFRETMPNTWVLEDPLLGTIIIKVTPKKMPVVGYHRPLKNKAGSLLEFFITPSKQDPKRKSSQEAVISEMFDEIDYVVQHELVHACQYYYKRKDPDAGSPFEKTDLTYTQAMDPKPILTDARKRGLNPSLISVHALDDAEFYSRILDEVTEINKHYPNGITNDQVRLWISASPLFVSLKNYQPKKYKKAVGLLYNEVSLRETRNKSAGLIRPSEELARYLDTLVLGAYADYWLRRDVIPPSERPYHLDLLRAAQSTGIYRYPQTRWQVQDSFLGDVRFEILFNIAEPSKRSFYKRIRSQDGSIYHNIVLAVNARNTNLTRKRVAAIRVAVRHELVHAYQSQMTLNMKGNSIAGIPQAKLDTHNRQDMVDREKALKEEFAKEGLDPSLISIHALDDIEFYTRLLDEVTFYQEEGLAKTPDGIRGWLDTREFFVSLKRFQPKKYKKAVGIFVSEIL